MAPSARRRRAPARLWLVLTGVAVCALAATAAGPTALRAPPPAAFRSLAPAGGPPPPSTDAAGSPGSCGGVCAPADAASTPDGPAGRPTRVRVPRIGVDAPLDVLGVDRTGQLVAPADFAHAGWYGDGPAPGDTGPAVIAGHLDSRSGPAVFSRVPELRTGDRIEVLRGPDWLPFRVTGSSRFAKDRFPTGAVYGPTPDPELRLITCGGVFDRRDRHYRDNVVVFAISDRPVEMVPGSAAG